ncbi:MAG TPA: TonB family protein [Pyrinomonadaceae bacterium]|nr:TonB family protein [Pyrinomonadaceae bacterium]
MRSHPLRNGMRVALLAACCLAPAQVATVRASVAPQQQPQPAALSAAAPASPEIERGVRLFRQNDVKGAVKAFRAATKRRKDDPVPWLYLSQALALTGDLKEALKANGNSLRLDPNFAAAHADHALIMMLSEKSTEAEASAARALQLDPGLAEAHYVLGMIHLRAGAWLKAAEEADAIIKLNDRFAPAYTLKAQALLGLFERGAEIIRDERRGAFDYNQQTLAEVEAAQPARLSEAADSLEKYLRVLPGARDAEHVRMQIESLRFYARTGRRGHLGPGDVIHSSSELTRKAHITSRPHPSFTEEARRAGTTGFVRLRAVLAWDGTVKHIMVLKSLPHGLTERAVAAARQIKFVPARAGETPVSQWVVIEYGFRVY